jgi:hypothetical protein
MLKDVVYSPLTSVSYGCVYTVFGGNSNDFDNAFDSENFLRIIIIRVFS